MSNTFGIISLIFGLLSLCCGWLIGAFISIPSIGWIFPIIAVIFGIIGIIRDDSKGMAIAGLILGLISFVCVAVFAVMLAAFIFALLSMGPP